jgi:hypothetical protein
MSASDPSGIYAILIGVAAVIGALTGLIALFRKAPAKLADGTPTVAAIQELDQKASRHDTELGELRVRVSKLNGGPPT